jgi:hypothetical protein
VASSIALASLRPPHPGGPDDETLEAFGRAAGAALEDLSEALREGRAPSAPPLEASSFEPGDPLLERSVVRVARQLAILHGTVSRLASERAPSQSIRGTWGATSGESTPESRGSSATSTAKPTGRKPAPR